MFDISFWELILVSVVALLVMGPDKLPGAIRTAGLWIGRLRRSFNNIKADIEREVGADEIRRQLRNEAIIEKFKSTKSQINETVNSVKKQADAVKEDLNIEKQVSDFKNEVEGSFNKDSAKPGPRPQAETGKPGTDSGTGSSGNIAADTTPSSSAGDTAQEGGTDSKPDSQKNSKEQ